LAGSKRRDARQDPAPALVAKGEGWTVRRFRDPAADTPAPASFALVRPFEAIAEGSQGPAPRFADAGAAWALEFDAGAGCDLYALGEVAGPLRRNARPTVCWNSDVPAYTPDDTSLYQSHPWVLGVRADATPFGLLVDTTWRCEIVPEETIVVQGTGQRPYVYVIEGDGPEQVLHALAELTGRAPMPPRWALGYHQCRWSYDSAKRVMEVAHGFRKRSIPCDAIWMDIDYMDGFRCFTFDPEAFADPRELCDTLHEIGFKTIWMIDPGIKKDPGYSVYDDGTRIDAWVKTDDAEPFVGTVWPGDCVFPDFTRQDVRTWWSGLYRDWLEVGIDAVWNDMNEPSVFDGPGKTMPEANRHEADASLGGPDAHERYHNVYGLLMVKATREGILAARPDKRPFVLTRANFIGGQRYAATWTGDNISSWHDLAQSIPMVLNLGLSGQPFAGPDIGGFNGDATPELFARWMGIGSLLPFARGHTVLGSVDHEPWSFGTECERVCKLALDRRMRLLPYLYTVFEESTRTGMPVVRPLFFADPTDPALRAVEDSFLLGGHVLVRARVTEDGECTAPMPPGDWKRFEPVEADLDLPELWLRDGVAIPLGPIMQHSAERPLDPLTIVANLDERGEARCRVYEDDGEGFGYQHGRFRRMTYLLRSGKAVIESIEGDLPEPERQVLVEVLD
jgi:alpha-glucosidase